MENTKKTVLTERPNETEKDGARGVTPGCPFWIFGKEEDAEKDVNKHFEVED